MMTASTFPVSVTAQQLPDEVLALIFRHAAGLFDLLAVDRLCVVCGVRPADKHPLPITVAPHDVTLRHSDVTTRSPPLSISLSHRFTSSLKLASVGVPYPMIRVFGVRWPLAWSRRSPWIAASIRGDRWEVCL